MSRSFGLTETSFPDAFTPGARAAHGFKSLGTGLYRCAGGGLYYIPCFAQRNYFILAVRAVHRRRALAVRDIFDAWLLVAASMPREGRTSRQSVGGAGCGRYCTYGMV